MFKTWNSIKEYSPVATEKTDFNGRIKLYTDYTRIDESNIQDVLNDLIFDIYENYRKSNAENYERVYNRYCNAIRKCAVISITVLL